MNAAVEVIIDGVIDREGRGFTNDPHDAGGPTRFGITAGKLGEWRKLGRAATAAEVEALQELEARAIYRAEYIEDPGFGAVLAIASRVALELIDTGVNMGVGTPGPWLQRGLNALNRGGRDYADLPVTGKVGPMTRAAIQGLIQTRGLDDAEMDLLKVLNGFQVVRYVELCEKRAANEDYAHGWLKNRVGL